MMHFRRFLILFFILSALGTCGKNDQFTTKLTASPFLAELYGESVKTIALSAEAGDHISWMGLEWSGDYKLFEVENVTVGSDTITPEASGPTAVFEDISILPPAPSVTPSGSEGPSTPTASKLLLRISYKPTRGLEAVDLPHRAYLLIAYDKPKTGVVRIELMGFVRGVAKGGCSSPASMDSVAYQVSGGKIKLYLCDTNGIPADQITGKSPNGDADVNLAEISIESDFVFYQPNETTVCLVGPSLGVAESIPEFKIPVPEGIPGIPDGTELPVKMKEAASVECQIENGVLLCDPDAGLELDVMGGTVPVSPLTVTSGSTEPTSPDCSNFGPMNGAGPFDSDSMTLIAWGVVESSSLTTGFKIDGALVVAEIPLEK